MSRNQVEVVSEVRVFLDQRLCHGCGCCVETAAHTFALGVFSGLGYVRAAARIVSGERVKDVVDAVNGCPCDAIAAFEVRADGSVGAAEGVM